jgi:chemotaxis signal transduction protein
MTVPNPADDSLADRAAQWRLAFDQSFAQAARGHAAALEDFLAIGVGGIACALKLAEVAALQPLRAVTPCPGSRQELLGLCSFRGAVLPVYDLRRLLGHQVETDGRQGAAEVPAWLVVAKAAPVALAFDRFEGHLRLPLEASTRPAVADGAQRHLGQVLRSGAQLRPIVSLASVVSDIEAIARLGVL